jgi:hypothetical protein
MKLEMTATERGKPAQMLCSVDQRTKFDGSAVVKLLGLPAGAGADDLPLTSADDKLIFNINTSDKTPVGSSSTLVCQITFTQNGEPIVQQAGMGGVLRVDPAAGPKKGAPTLASAAPRPAAGSAAKPLSRLEKLRLEEGQQ